MKVRAMYVLQREDGKFYWKGNNSSQWGYKDDFSEAYLFKTQKGAQSRAGLDCEGQECYVREVIVFMDNSNKKKG